MTGYMLVDRGERKVTSFKPTKYDLATAYVDTVGKKVGCLFFSWNKNMIFKCQSDPPRPKTHILLYNFYTTM